jgi:uncharacterized protein YbjQ (UPF0145 family)
MILTTTNNIEGHKIVDYLNIVTGVSIVNFGVFKNNIEEIVNKAKEIAFQQLKTNAINQKANAVVGILVDMELLENNHKVSVSIVGTAVKVH